MSANAYQQYLAELQLKYEQALATLGLAPGSGVLLSCPSCGQSSWMTIPIDRRGHDDYEGNVIVSCPTACGYFGLLSTFSPTSVPDEPLTYDTSASCQSCQVRFAVDGVVYRRPCCGIENPREVMSHAVSRVRTRLSSSGFAVTRAEIEDELSFLVSTFDGLMRRMLAVANENARYILMNVPGHPHSSALAVLPSGISFQSLTGARQKLLAAGWDMASVGSDWPSLVRLFQKRHVIAHRLGVVDQDYIRKTQDPEATVGKRVPISVAEVVTGAEACLRIVRSFFGNFLS